VGAATPIEAAGAIRPPQRFIILILIGRPASGKSEIINYLKKTEREERIRRFHIGDLDEIDDFPILWAWFEEDSLLEKMGKPRLHTTEDGYFKYPWLWDLLMRKISFEYEKRTERDVSKRERVTTIIEFSRGSEHGGFRRAFLHLSRDILMECAVLYIDVSYEESLRKNRKRFNPQAPGSILEHSIPDRKMEVLYKYSDWEQFCKSDPEYLSVKGVQVPFVVFDNEDDVTSGRGEALGRRLEAVLSRLWKLYAGGAE
jgi:hypothetical protein